MLAIVAAFKEELKDYLRRGKFKVAERTEHLRFYRSASKPQVVAVVGGYGRERAQQATREVIERYRPEVIVSAGFAGGVKPGIGTGDLFLCNRLSSIAGSAAYWTRGAAKERPPQDSAVVDKLLEETIADYTVCGCLSVPQLVSSSSMKAWIGATFPVDIIDMEGYWATEAAAAAGTSSVVVRAVLDPVEQTLPMFVGQAVDDGADRMWRRALRYIVTRPTEAPLLIHMAGQAKVASASLADFLWRLKPTDP